MTARLDPAVKAANKIKFGKIRSERVKGKGNSFYGKHHTAESIEKNRISHIGLPSPRKGKHHTEESKEKIRLSQLGKPEIERIIVQPEDPSIRYISLTKGLYAIVDAKNYGRINHYLWVTHKSKNTFYAQRALPRENGVQKNEKMHHMIIGYPPKGLMIDHINGNGLDNRECNLRFVTNRENCMNRHQNYTSRYPGVTWNKRSNVWNAQAQVNGKQIHIGTFHNEIDAYNAYLAVVRPIEQKLMQEKLCTTT
ncbi:MAG: NUMOD3 domain-containing DNA-binding protein [Alphaproteobacteria bacterium]|nr:NUMOD3 domain-containing DNA-binding protein [Alphaproteobacteria bacterium]